MHINVNHGLNDVSETSKLFVIKVFCFFVCFLYVQTNLYFHFGYGDVTSYFKELYIALLFFFPTLVSSESKKRLYWYLVILIIGIIAVTVDTITSLDNWCQWYINITLSKLLDGFHFCHLQLHLPMYISSNYLGWWLLYHSYWVGI